jgi:hypothetical protein
MARNTQREEPVTKTSTYRNSLVRALALSVTIAAVAAPIAQAQTPIPADLANRQFWAVATLPDELSGRQLGPSNLQLVTIPSDLSGRDFGPATFTPDIPVAIPAADGFDWRDAGIGAAVVAAVGLMLGALALLVGRRRDLAGV